MEYKGHCNSCGKEVEFSDGELVKTEGKKKKVRSYVKGTCPDCGSKVLDWQSKYAEPEQPPTTESESIETPEESALECIPSQTQPDDSGEVILDEDVEVLPPDSDEAKAISGGEFVEEVVKQTSDEVEKKKEEETDWTEYLPIIIIVIGLIVLLVGTWLIFSKKEKKDKKENAKKEKGD